MSTPHLSDTNLTLGPADWSSATSFMRSLKHHRHLQRQRKVRSSQRTRLDQELWIWTEFQGESA